MPRLKNLIVAAINVTTEPPHSDQRYIDLFKLMRSMIPVAIGTVGKNERLMLDYFAEASDSLSGAFARCTHIDPRSPWWDFDNRKAILDENGKPVPQARSGVGPNLKHIHFFFDLANHLLVFDTREVSPRQLAFALQQIVLREEVVAAFGRVNITVVPKHDEIEKLLALPRKRQIRVVVTLPNGPDVPDTLEGRIKSRYQSMHLRKAETLFVGQTDHDIEPDAELKATVNVASTNGFAEVSYVGDSGVIECQSTKDYPRREKHKCFPDEYWSTIRWLASKFVGSPANWQNEAKKNIEQ